MNKKQYLTLTNSFDEKIIVCVNDLFSVFSTNLKNGNVIKELILEFNTKEDSGAYIRVKDKEELDLLMSKVEKAIKSLNELE